jgi:hypothetical protein
VEIPIVLAKAVKFLDHLPFELNKILIRRGLASKVRNSTYGSGWILQILSIGTRGKELLKIPPTAVGG